jgi:hypothetical protein
MGVREFGLIAREIIDDCETVSVLVFSKWLNRRRGALRGRRGLSHPGVWGWKPPLKYLITHSQ